VKRRGVRRPRAGVGQLALLFALLGAVVVAERLAPLLQDAGEDAGTLPPDAVGPCRVRKVVDGDTVRLRCGEEELHVRLLRIDTPELGEPRHREAAEALRTFLDGADAWVVYEEPGRPARGNYGRLLAYLFVDARNVNVEMVRAGWSHFDTRWGEGRFAGAFRRAAAAAAREGRL
jgi:endonuclease YncB( thermonuclease family)